MDNKIKLVGLTLGDPFNIDSRSGVNYNVFTRLQDKCDLIDVLDLDLVGFNKLLSALKNFSFNRRKWGSKLHQNPWAFNVRTKFAERKLKEMSSEYDLIYQDGAMFMPGRVPKMPFVSYHDSNVIISAQGGTSAHGAHYRGSQLKKTIEQEKRVYDHASVIFTMSNWLKRSMIKDFGISEDKIETVYAGTNLEIKDFEKCYDGKTVLFVGKNFERKGGMTLLKAFRIVRKEIKDARLIIIGPNLDIEEEGVEIKGLLRDKKDISNYFKMASVFVMPSLFEPFGLVFLEAFTYKTPCIGSNICAMPEIIEEGKGGFLISPNDVKMLADRIITLLTDECLAKNMGSYGFEKVNNIYNWDTVVNKMVFHFSKII